MGPVPDQVALHGILRRIHDLGLTLMLVQRLEAADPGPSSADSAQPGA